jgi:hypothetical protein
MNSTMTKASQTAMTRLRNTQPRLSTSWVPNSEECYIQFAQALANVGDFPVHWLNNFRIQSSDMKLARTLRVGGENGLTCVIRTSPRLENYFQENANPLIRVGEPLFDRLSVELIQRLANLCLGTTLMIAPEIQAGVPKGLLEREPATVCKVMVDVTFLEIIVFRGPLSPR